MGSGIRYGVSLETQFLKHGNDHLDGDGLELFSDEDEAVDESLNEPVVIGEVLPAGPGTGHGVHKAGHALLEEVGDFTTREKIAKHLLRHLVMKKIKIFIG